MNLAIFDFDGTLRRVSGRWNDGIVEDARRAIARGDYVVVLTGQPVLTADWVRKSLAGKQLAVNEIITVGPLFTLRRKKLQIQRLVGQVRPKRVELWDDNAPMLSEYARMLDHMGIVNMIHWVSP